MRRSLYEAASAMLTRYKGKTALKTWGAKLAKRCHKKAVVAVARKLAVIMHAMWRDGSEYADRPDGCSAEKTRRRRRIASFWAPTRDVRTRYHEHGDGRLSARRDPL